MKRKTYVSVIGPSECSEWEAQAAENVGRLLASNDVTVICGGRGGGWKPYVVAPKKLEGSL